MNLNELMSFIDKLTPQQAAGYVSGRQPFPYKNVPPELWAPRMLASANRKLAEGGPIKPITKSMQDMLMKRYAMGGGVQRFADGDPVKRSKYGYVIAYDAMGKEIGMRKDTDPPFTEEATTKPAGMYAASDATQPSMFTSVREKEKYMEGKNKALMTPINMAKDLVGGITDLIGMNTNPRKPNMPALNEAINKGQMPPMPPEVKAEQESFRAVNPVGTPITTPSAPQIAPTAVPVGAPVNTTLDTTGFNTAAERLAPKTAKENMEGLQSLMAQSREKERLAELQKQQGTLEEDRKRDMWLGILQAAGKSMAEGNRSFLGALGSTAAGAAGNVAASEKDYRGRKSDLAKQKMGIEDTADALLNQVALKGFDLTNEQNRTAVELELKKLGLSEKQIELAFKRNKDLREESELRSQNALRAAQAESYKEGGRGGAGGLNAYQLAQIRDKAKDNMKDNPQFNLAMAKGDMATADAILQKEVDRLLAQPGTSGTMQSAPQSTIRDINKWSVK